MELSYDSAAYNKCPTIVILYHDRVEMVSWHCDDVRQSIINSYPSATSIVIIIRSTFIAAEGDSIKAPTSVSVGTRPTALSNHNEDIINNGVHNNNGVRRARVIAAADDSSPPHASSRARPVADSAIITILSRRFRR